MSYETAKAIVVNDPKGQKLLAYLDREVHVTRHCCTSCGFKCSMLLGFPRLVVNMMHTACAFVPI